MNFQIPSKGISIDRTRTDSKSSHIIQLKLSDRETGDLIQHLKDGGNAKLRTGRHLVVEAGKQRIAVHQGADKHQEIFRGSLDGDKPIFFSGKIDHVLEVAQAKEAIAGADSALDKLKNTLKQVQDERSSQDTGLASKLLKASHRPSPLSAGLLNSRPSSPFLNAGYSPRVGPTSAPLLSGQSKQDKVRSKAIKIPVIHLLATKPYHVTQLVEELRAKRVDIEAVLAKVAEPAQGKGVHPGQKQLSKRAYKELDVWKFPYRNQSERQMAIDNAIAAFDRQRIDKTDNLWQMLLAKEDRGKGTYLSKLNFDKPLNPGNLTPKIAERSTTDGTSTEGRSVNSLASGDSKKAKPVTKSEKPRLTAEQIARNLTKGGNQSVKSGVSKYTSSRKATQTPKSDVKVKSAEKILDSDSDAGVHRVTVTKRKDPSDVFKPLKVPARESQSIKDSSNLDTDRGRRTPNEMVKTRGGTQTNAVEAKSTLSQSRNVSRPRTGSSPMKPSPLGSSPPTNTRDGDTSSNSSKSTTLSSAPSSPPFSATKDQKNSTDKASNGTKRKAAPHENAPPAKKAQVNGTKPDKRPNGLPSSLADEIDRRQATKRSTPDSDASSVSEKSLTRESVIDDAKRFQKYYVKYKDLHDNVNRQPEADRKDEDIDKVWSMHKRLSDLKDKIWKDWDTIEKARS